MQEHYYDLRYQVDETEWRAKAKRSLVFQLFKKYKTKRSNLEILDFGCGSGALQVELIKAFPKAKIFGVDVSKKTIDYCKKRGLKNSFVFDGKKLPFGSNKFDLVTAIDVIEHIKDDEGALKEIYRVLKPKGIAVVLVPAHQNLWSTRDSRLKHFRRYEQTDLIQKSSQTKYKTVTIKNVDFALYFVFRLIRSLAKKKKGVPDLGMETAKTNPLLNQIFYLWELFENKLQNFVDFPIGLSIITVIKK